jgi:hypothetical protein
MVPWESPGDSDSDYLSNFGGAGNNLPDPGALPGPLADDANWSTLGREYAFNIALAPGSGPPPFKFTVEASGPDLVLKWDSKEGRLYNLRSALGLSTEPTTWPIFGGHENIEATPPENTLTIARPSESERFFVIEQFPAPPETEFFDDFENGQGEWTLGNDGLPGTAWEIGSPTVGPPAAFRGTNCFGTNLSSDYAFDARVWLRSPPIDLTTAGEATLSYYQFVDVEGLSFDFGVLSVLDASDDSVLKVLEEEVDAVTADWEKVTKALPPEALGKTIRIEFRLFTDDFDNSNFPGWYVDDFHVTVP